MNLTKSGESGGVEWELTVNASNGHQYVYDKDAITSGCSDEGNDEDGTTKQPVCHVPPGNPSNAHTIYPDNHSWAAHVAHGDSLGACASADPCSDPDQMQNCEQSGIVY